MGSTRARRSRGWLGSFGLSSFCGGLKGVQSFLKFRIPSINTEPVRVFVRHSDTLFRRLYDRAHLLHLGLELDNLIIPVGHMNAMLFMLRLVPLGFSLQLLDLRL